MRSNQKPGKTCIAVILSILALSTTETQAQQAESIDLLEGKALEHFQATEGWHRVERAVDVPDRTELTTRGNTGSVLVNGKTKDISIPYLFTRASFSDVHVELEFMIPKGSNAGVYLMGRYEVQILDSHGKEKVGSGDLGGIYENAEPLQNTAKAPGRWQTMEITFQAPRFDAERKKISDAKFESVLINGIQVQSNVSVSKPTRSNPLAGEVPSGPITIQGDHGPIAIRKFIATPLASPVTAAANEIDAYWAEVERAMSEGDFAAYADTIHPQGVIISGNKQTSYPLTQALSRWKSDFEDTSSGRVRTDLKFRFSHRYHDLTTAHQSGIFRYSSDRQDAKATTDYIAFEALLTKLDDKWQMLMEYQKRPATETEWNNLAP